MLTDHLGMHRTRIDVDLGADGLSQPGRVEHGPGADHTFRRQPGAFREHVGQHIDRIGDDDHDPAIAAQ